MTVLRLSPILQTPLLLVDVYKHVMVKQKLSMCQFMWESERGKTLTDYELYLLSTISTIPLPSFSMSSVKVANIRYATASAFQRTDDWSPSSLCTVQRLEVSNSVLPYNPFYQLTRLTQLEIHGTCDHVPG